MRNPLPRVSGAAAALLVTATLLIGTAGATVGVTDAAARSQRLPDLKTTSGNVKVSKNRRTVFGRFTVSNRGKTLAKVSTAYLQARAGGRYRYLTESRILGLKAGRRAAYLYAADRPRWMKPGSHAVRVCLDVKHKVRESNEANNCTTLGKAVVPPSAGWRFPAYQTDSRFLVGDTTSGYYAWVPSGYSAAQPSHLLVWLHGCGGYSRDDVNEFHAPAAESYITIAPTGREGTCWKTPSTGTGSDDAVLKAIADVSKHLAIDPNAISLGGYSSGGDLSYRLAYKHSAKFDQVLVCNSSPFRDTGLTESQALAAATTKFGVHHLLHLSDEAYPVDGVRSELQALSDAGFVVDKVEKPGSHYDEPGTYDDIRLILLPFV